jgi:hypothetical protein
MDATAARPIARQPTALHRSWIDRISRLGFIVRRPDGTREIVRLDLIDIELCRPFTQAL